MWLLLLSLFLALGSFPACGEGGKTLTLEEQAEALGLIAELEQSCKMRQTDYESMKTNKELTDKQLVNLERINNGFQNLTDSLQNRIDSLEILVKAREISLTEAKTKMQQISDDYNASVKSYQAQILRLKFKIWCYRIGIAVAVIAKFIH
jgi:uncharacterized membrane protein YjjP (DUF1212 family)